MFNENTLKIPAARKFLIAQLHKDVEDNWQENDTPYHIVNKMIDIIPKDTETYVVFFNLEFVEVLVHERNIPPENILFVADVKIEYLFAKRGYKVNAVLFPKQTITNESIGNILKGVEMKIGKMAVIGNPPYQMQTDAQKNRSSEDQQSKPIYNLFVEAIIDNVKPDYFSFIIPSRWMVGGMGLTNHRERMMNDSRMQKIVHIPDSSSIFPTVDIKGGVNYFLWNNSYNGPCEFVVGNTSTMRKLNQYDIILQDNDAISILEKINSKTNNWISSKVFGNKPFGIATNFKNWSTEGIKCISVGLKQNFVSEEYINDKNEIKDVWKVCMSKAGDGGFSNPDKSGKCSVIGRTFILEPGEICTETYIVVNVFDDKESCENFISYINTKFFRFMLGLRVMTQDVNKEKFSWVPDMINYNKSWNDNELYNIFGLDSKEISYIESKIKEI